MTPYQRGSDRLNGLNAIGVFVWLKEDGKLGYRAPATVDREELLSCLKEWRSDLVAKLKADENAIWSLTVRP